MATYLVTFMGTVLFSKT